MNREALLGEELQRWLLDGEPWVVYRTLVDLLDCDDDDERVVAARKAETMDQLKEVISAIRKLNKVRSTLTMTVMGGTKS